MKKENQRITITKKMLKNSLVEILKTKSIYKVSIRELCEKSEINRSTFYKYYASQFDLLTDMEDDLITSIMNSLSDNTLKSLRPLSEVFHYLEENMELVRLLINNNIDSQFPEKLFSMPQVREIINHVLGDKYTEAEFTYISNFLTYGAYQVIRVWCNKQHRETPEEIAALLLTKIFPAVSTN